MDITYIRLADVESSDETRRRNERRRDHKSGPGRCLLCQAPIKSVYRMVELTTDLRLAPEGSEVPEDISQGGFPVGPECSARLRRAFKEAES